MAQKQRGAGTPQRGQTRAGLRIAGLRGADRRGADRKSQAATTARPTAPRSVPRTRDDSSAGMMRDKAAGEDQRPQKVGVALDAFAEVKDQLTVLRQVARIDERDERVIGDEVEEQAVRNQSQSTRGTSRATVAPVQATGLACSSRRRARVWHRGERLGHWGTTWRAHAIRRPRVCDIPARGFAPCPPQMKQLRPLRLRPRPPGRSIVRSGVCGGARIRGGAGRRRSGRAALRSRRSPARRLADLGGGELVALVGRSGSGKSTLLAVLGGLDREYSGRVQVFGQDLSTLSDAQLSQLRNERIGFVFQSFHLLDHLSALENVLLPTLFPPSRCPMPPPEAGS